MEAETDRKHQTDRMTNRTAEMINKTLVCNDFFTMQPVHGV